MRPYVLAAALTLATLPVLLPRNAQAQDRTAETLYQEGKAAAGKKDWVVACAKFQESNTREPAPGTLLNLGDCEENRGLFALAISHFEAAARMCKPGDERADYARQRSFALERRAPKLVLRLHASTPTGTTVERDGVAVGATQLGTPIVVDAGEHRLVVRAPGRSESRGSVLVAAGESREIELTAGMPIPGATTAPAGPATQADKPAPAMMTSGDPGSSARTGAYVAFGVGAVGLGIGIVGGLMTMSAKSTADSHCPPAGCDKDGLDAESRGKTWSAVGTVGFIAAGVGLATGAGLLLFAPKAQAGQPQMGALSVSPTVGGAAVRWVGSF